MVGLRSLTAVAAAAALVTLTLTVSSGAMRHVSTKPKCSVLTARDRILSSSLPQRVKDSAAGKNGGGVDQLMCRDVTRDGRKDMTVLVSSGGAAEVNAWVVFRNKRGRWKLSLKRLKVYQAAVKYAKGDLVEVSAVLLQDDQKCCPTGGFDHRRFHWAKKRTRFVVAKFWHSRNP